MILLVLRLKAELIARWERAPEAKVADLPGVGRHTICRQHPCVKRVFRQFFGTSYREDKANSQLSAARMRGADTTCEMFWPIMCREHAMAESVGRLVKAAEPSFSATACSWFMMRVRACTIQCRCHSSCRRSRFSPAPPSLLGPGSRHCYGINYAC